MKWDDFANTVPVSFDGQVLTNIECPQCGRQIYLNKRIVLTSYPEKYSYWCTCGWNGYSAIQWEEDHELM